MSLSDYSENYLLDYLLEATLYVAASTADPGDDGATIAEPVGGSYARTEVTTATWDAASGGTKSNGAAITFPEATGDWGTITHLAIFSAASGGNLICSDALTASKAISSGQTLRVPIGSFDVTLS